MTGTATSSPTTNRSSSASVAVGEGVDHRGGQLLGGRARPCSPARSRSGPASPSAAGPSRATRALITAAAPSSRNVSCGRHTDAGVRMPARAATALATGLSNAVRHDDGRCADVGHVEQLEHLAHGAVLAGLAVQHRHHAGGALGAQQLQQRGVHVALDDLEPGARAGPRPPGARSAARRRARGTARRPAPATRPSGRAEPVSAAPDGRASGSCSRGLQSWSCVSAQVGGGGVVAAARPERPGRGPAPAPNVARSSISYSITPASRRTPSRIRSGVG